MDEGCKEVKLYDDDDGSWMGGSPQDMVYTSSQSKLPWDLEHDVRMVEVWAIDVPSKPQSSPQSGESAGHATHSATAAEFPNIHLIASGYNIFYADPAPKMDLGSDAVNVDPGLRKPVFKIKYSENRLTGDRRHKRPDGYFATVDYGCSEVFSTKTISDDYGMSTERNLEASITEQVGLDVDSPPTSDKFSFQHGDVGVQDTAGLTSFGAFVGGSGTLSGSYQHIQATNLFKDNRLVQSSAKCAVYTAGVAYGFPPEIDPDFKAKAGDASSSSDWWEVFDEFGTHFLSNIKMGARFGSMMIFKKDHYDAMTSTVAEAGLELGPVIEAGIKTAVTFPEAEDQLSWEFAPAQALPGVPLINQKSVKNVTSHASAQIFQGVGPRMPPGGASKWIDEVAKNPVPMRFSKMEICAHPGLSSSQRSKCTEALQVYCEEHLKAKGAICEPPEKRQCQMDSDCEQGSVCRSFKCEKVPVCYVSVYNGKGYSGHEYVLDPVTSIDHPSGKAISMRLDNWHDKIKSFRLGIGCKQVKLYDDDSGGLLHGNAQNKIYTSSQSSLINDLKNDVSMVEVWAEDVPGTPPFQPGLGEAPSNLPRPEKITFDPAKDTLFAEPKKSTGLNVEEGTEFFPNIGKAMYGYNQFHGSPFSTKYAGSDPGFQPRGVWKMTYSEGNVGTEAIWRRMPMAPNARYFVLFAQKHPQVNQMQEDAKDPAGAATRYLKGQEEVLKKKLQEMRDGKIDYNTWKYMYMGYSLPEYVMTEPEVPLEKPSDEFCAVQQSCKELRQSIISEGYDKYREQCYKDWEGCYEGSSWEKQPPWIGETICQDGKAHIWTKEDNAAYYDSMYGGQGSHYSGGYYGRRALLRRRLAKYGRFGEVTYDEGDVDDSQWYSVQHQPNIREFPTLAKAKQALRSEARCIGNFESGEWECPSGADYDLNIDGTKWSHADSRYHNQDKYEAMVGVVLRKRWPRFIVKVSDDKVSDAEIEMIDGQDQRKGWRTGFDSVFPHDYDTMISFLEEHVAANPSDGKLMEAETALATKVPDGWSVTRSKGGAFCEQDMKTDTVSDAHSYEKLTSSSFGIPTTGGTVMGNGFSFGLSYEKKELLKNEGRKGEKMVATQAECGTYYAKMVDLEGNPPETEPSLAFLAGKAEQEDHFWMIFDQYGLHFPTEVVFGARYGTSQFIRESKFMEYQRTEEALTLEFGAQVAIPTKVPGVDVQVSRDTSIGYSGTDEEKRVVDKYFEERRVFSIGKRIPEGGMEAWIKDIGGEPMPIKFGLESLCKHPAFKVKKDMCTAASLTYCEQHLKRLHPEVECTPSPKSECLWDTDCEEHPNARCRQGVCFKKPRCEVQIFDQNYFKGESTVLGPVFHQPHKPYEIFDLAHVESGKFRGRVGSLKMSGGCGKIVKMGSNNLDGGDNFALTNHKGNGDKELTGVSNCNYIAMYPKEFDVDEGSEWFQDKR